MGKQLRKMLKQQDKSDNQLKQMLDRAHAAGYKAGKADGLTEGERKGREEATRSAFGCFEEHMKGRILQLHKVHGIGDILFKRILDALGFEEKITEDDE